MIYERPKPASKKLLDAIVDALLTADQVREAKRCAKQLSDESKRVAAERACTLVTDRLFDDTVPLDHMLNVDMQKLASLFERELARRIK